MEGPSLVILREEASRFKGKRILSVTGNSKSGIDRLARQILRDIRTWGKHFVLCFDGFILRIHFLMFGSYRINARKENPRLSLVFRNGELNFYNCSVRFLEGSFEDHYDEKTDVMSARWDEKRALSRLSRLPADVPACDILLDQSVFSGVGNIIKNEVLYRLRMNPLTKVSSLSPSQRKSLVADAREYSYLFLAWRRLHELKKHWQVYKQKNCPSCGTKLTRSYAGHPARLTFHCPHCQVLPYRRKANKLLRKKGA